MKHYRIKDWTRYETHETRKIKSLSWVPIPNKHDGLAFKRIAQRPDACEIFAAWVLMLQVASKGPQDQRGLLERDGIPLSPDDLRMMTGYPSASFAKAYDVLSSASVGWLEVYKESPAVPGDHPDVTGFRPIEGRKEGTERTEGTEQNTASSDDDGFSVFWKTYPRRVGKSSALKAWKRAKKPSLDAIIAKINALKASTQWTKDGGQFIPHPATWINRGGWDDEIETTNERRGAVLSCN